MNLSGLAGFENTFMQLALAGLLLLAPIVAIMGVHAVQMRMAFFSDAISHSVFAGVAISLLFNVHPQWTMPLFGLLIGIAIMAIRRASTLSTDTVIAVTFSAVVAFGLAIISRNPGITRELTRFLYGDILTVDTAGLIRLAVCLVGVIVLQVIGGNRLLYIGISPVLAAAHGIAVRRYQYLYAALLALVIINALWAVGVLLVTALLVVPAAAARNLAASTRGLFLGSFAISASSSVIGLVLSAQPWARTASGPTILLCAFTWFLFSLAANRSRIH